MRHPIHIREITAEERRRLEEGLRSSDAFTVRRSQILLASARGEMAPRIAEYSGRTDQAVRNAIKAFNERGVAAIEAGSTRPKSARPVIFGARQERLKELVRHNPREHGKESSLWTLSLLAEVSFEEGLTPERVSRESIRRALKRLEINWKRAKHWITSPDPAYGVKKNYRDRLSRACMAHPEWALGFVDEVWWSRFSHPDLSAWAEERRPLRLVGQSQDKADPEPKAIACYGMLLRSRGEDGGQPDERMLLRFVDGRPVSAITAQFLQWCCQALQAMGKRVLALVWDNASWHISREVREWLRAHNRQVKASGCGVRILVCPLPSKSPWLNPIEPKWLHGKRRVLEAGRTLTAEELRSRVCAAYGLSYEEHLSISKKVA